MSTKRPIWLRSACAHYEDWAHILKVLYTLTFFFSFFLLARIAICKLAS